jgi:hypothetical protein
MQKKLERFFSKYLPKKIYNQIRNDLLFFCNLFPFGNKVPALTEAFTPFGTQLAGKLAPNKN